MLDAIFIGMSGMLATSRGLTNISGNVANLNTAGYKRFELAYQDAGYRAELGSGGEENSPYSLGDGVSAGNAVQVFKQGELRQTGNPLDVAIDGDGLLVLQRDGKVLYTRSGQFAFDTAGLLTAREDGARVQGLRGGSLVDISLDGRRDVPARATHTIEFSDTLSVGDDRFSVGGIDAIDSRGVKHTLTMDLINDKATAPGQWKFTLKEGGVQITEGTLRYDSSGHPVVEHSKQTFSYTLPGDAAVEVTLDFTKTTQFSSSGSSFRATNQDGKPAGSLVKASFDEEGFLVLAYANGDSVKAEQLAIASVPNPQQLRAMGDNRFTLPQGSALTYGVAKSAGLGTVHGGNLEASNVDLSQEFGELIIAQRAYQASSQVINAANEMIQQLSELKGRR
jgi:flagellar hook protein FlgE